MTQRAKAAYVFARYCFPKRLDVHVCAQYLWSDRGATRHGGLVFFRVGGSRSSVCISPAYSVLPCVSPPHTLYRERTRKIILPLARFYAHSTHLCSPLALSFFSLCSAHITAEKNGQRKVLMN